MFVKVIKRYNDTVLEASLPVGVILEVDADRAEKLLNAKVCEEFTFTKKGKEAKKEVPVETPEELPTQEPAEPVIEPEQPADK
jgi:hypothetical protein